LPWAAQTTVYDDWAAGQTDPQLANFSIAHDSTYIIPLLQEALAINSAAKWWRWPWSPPAWMKTGGTMNGGGMNPAYFPSLAQYFVLYLQAYQQAGIPSTPYRVQNEPLYAPAPIRASIWQRAMRGLHRQTSSPLRLDMPA